MWLLTSLYSHKSFVDLVMYICAWFYAEGREGRGL